MKPVTWIRLAWLLLLLVACDGGNPLAAPTATLPPPTDTPEPAATPTPGPATAAGFDLFLAEAQAARPNERQPLVNRYLAQLPATPITDGNRAIFLWQGTEQRIQLAGDMNNWDLSVAPELTRLEGADLWYLSAEFESNARLDYKFVTDGGNWHLDPLNPRTAPGGFGPNSELAMPAYETPSELQPPSEAIPAGTLTTHTLDSAHLNQTRTFFVYTPAGQIVGEALPSIYFHDGGDYLNLIDTPVILDRLIANRQIPPLIAVFIPPINRDREYNRNDAYVNFLADELVPFVRATYGVDPSPARTGTIGPSMAGLAAVYAAIARPDVFGLAAGQSGAYSVDSDAIIERIRAEQMAVGIGGPARREIRFYLVVGTYETAVGGDGDTGNLLEANRRLVEALESLDYEYQYQERPEGHSWGLWQATLGDALAYLLAG
ncbi:MAG: hypothetical protein L0332_28970 [Chloroflexi bacterium]|nr:hypothetical protein [Chloroflexota bacterium]MCI0576600.1 hypothetical protein [Chloroflexota bacterium]MCI0647032.1 hypothetical protein [Chloroflexota bacterium]MCI0730732.1 hypothetical protein [Chloroflexota bacterium]